jgi:hypothetical protein
VAAVGEEAAELEAGAVVVAEEAGAVVVAR